VFFDVSSFGSNIRIEDSIGVLVLKRITFSFWETNRKSHEREPIHRSKEPQEGSLKRWDGLITIDGKELHEMDDFGFYTMHVPFAKNKNSIAVNKIRLEPRDEPYSICFECDRVEEKKSTKICVLCLGNLKPVRIYSPSPHDWKPINHRFMSSMVRATIRAFLTTIRNWKFKRDTCRIDLGRDVVYQIFRFM